MQPACGFGKLKCICISRLWQWSIWVVCLGPFQFFLLRKPFHQQNDHLRRPAEKPN